MVEKAFGFSWGSYELISAIECLTSQVTLRTIPGMVGTLPDLRYSVDLFPIMHLPDGSVQTICELSNNLTILLCLDWLQCSLLPTARNSEQRSNPLSNTLVTPPSRNTNQSMIMFTGVTYITVRNITKLKGSLS